MTNEFATQFQQVTGSGFDYLTSGTQPSEKGVAPAQRNTLRTSDTDSSLRKPGDPWWLGRFELGLRDFSLQGVNHPEGDFSSNSNGYAWSTLITGQANELLGSLDPVNDTSGSLSGNMPGMHSAVAFSTLFIGIGSAANNSLFKEAGSSNLDAVTYTPAGEICSLTNVLAAGAERLAVGEVGQPVRLISNDTGSVATTMHSSTNSCWGIINSGINATSTSGAPTMLMYCGTTLGTKATDAADLTTTIVVTKTGLNAGGKAIGAVRPKGRSQRAYWLFPKASNTSGALKYGAEAAMEIWSSDMKGGDLLPLWPLGKPSNYCPNGVTNAVPYREGIVYWDSTHLIYWDGQEEFDLGLFTRRVRNATVPNQINHNFLNRIRDVCVDGPSLYCLWEDYFFNGLSAGHIYFEYYNYEAGSWHNQQEVITLANASVSAATVLCGAGGIPVSPSRRIAYTRTQGDTTWWTFFVPRAAESILYQNTIGRGSDSTGLPNYRTGDLVTASWWLDGIRRLPKAITEVEFEGNLDHGENATTGTTWTLRVRVVGKGHTAHVTAYDKTFAYTTTQADYVKRNDPAKIANIFDLQVWFTATCAQVTAPATATFLPVVIRGVYSKDRRKITSEMAGLLWPQ